MKKTSKIVAVVIAALLVVAALVVFAACGKTYTGECKYENTWNKGSYYGVKVDVTVKGDVITAVKLYSEEETGWTRTSGSWKENQNPGDLGFEKTEAKYDEWIEETFVGADIAEVLGWSATATEKGQTVGAGVPHIAGATQSSARIIIAVQNALEQIEGIEKVTGEYKYENTWTPGAYYGAKVDVYLRDGKVLAVRLYEDKETDWTRTTGSWKENQNAGDLGFAKAEAAYSKWIKDTFVGKTVEEINALEAKKDGWVISDSAKLAGATQSAVRIVLAVQNALSKVK